MPDHLAHVDGLGLAPPLHLHPDGQGGLPDDALTKAVLLQLGKLGPGKLSQPLSIMPPPWHSDIGNMVNATSACGHFSDFCDLRKKGTKKTMLKQVFL